MKILTPHSGNTPNTQAGSVKKAETRKRFKRSSSVIRTPKNPSKRKKLDENAKSAPELSCDVQANFDLSCFLDNGSFNTLYNRDIEAAVNVSVDLGQEPPPEPEEVYVYQCPVTKGGPQCPELAMDSSGLMIHWGTQHHTRGEQFSQLRVNMDQVSHYHWPF